MNKAFIFDLDGVLIDDEKIWEGKKQELYVSIFGSDLAVRMGPTTGVNMDGIYEKALNLGTEVPKESLIKAFYEIAEDIYETAPLTEGIGSLAETLKKLNYRIGIVSASPLEWVTSVTKRLSFEDDIELIISLHERHDLDHKPSPEGYQEAIRILQATPQNTVILEDSNIGIASAKASGAFTIGLKQNLVRGYKQEGADTYANNLNDVEQLIRQFGANS